jgi:glycosyltransferase involved in cell wall biosynthesis
VESPVADPFLSVVVPAFNEEQCVDSTLESVVGYLDRQPYSWELLLVDDGSTDDTAALAKAYADKSESGRRVRVETIPHRGKGWAVRHGMLAARGQYRFMCDADLAMPIDQLAAFLDRMAEGFDVVIGSREKEGARRFGEPMGRHIRGRLFNRVVRLLAVGGFEDTQCGYKCFRGQVADEIFRLQKTSGLAFDVEILYLAVKRKMRVLEMPIDWYHRSPSRVRPLVDSFLMLRDTLLVRLGDILGRRYS